MLDHIATVDGRNVTVGPGACKRFDIHVDALMNGQRSIILELLATASKRAPITFGTMFSPLMQHHFDSSVASEVALPVGAFELAVFMVLVVVINQTLV